LFFFSNPWVPQVEAGTTQAPVSWVSPQVGIRNIKCTHHSTFSGDCSGTGFCLDWLKAVMEPVYLGCLRTSGNRWELSIFFQCQKPALPQKDIRGSKRIQRAEKRPSKPFKLRNYIQAQKKRSIPRDLRGPTFSGQTQYWKSSPLLSQSIKTDMWLFFKWPTSGQN
jgi:hypothetical protein